MNKNTDDYFMFLRISDDEFINSLQKQGLIYCNTIRYFRAIEDNGIKGDQNEGKAYIKQVNNLKILKEGKIFATAKNAQVYFDNLNDIGNIFCLYGVKTSIVDLNKSKLQKVIIEDGSRELGKSALIITQPEEFINRISKKLMSLSKEFDFHSVYYYDHHTYEGELSPFYKSNKYEYQNEVRLWIPQQKEDPYQFFIGDISDISYKISVSDLDKIAVEVL